MPTWKKILCPIDFSETSRMAMLESLELAKKHEAQVFLLHVLEERWPVAHGDLLAPPEYLARRNEGAAREMSAWKEVAVQVAPGRVLTEMVSGHPATEILRMAHEGDFDVIVLGTHGRRGLRRLMMGSVAAEVARTAPCSVVVVRPRTRGEFEVVPD